MREDEIFWQEITSCELIDDFTECYNNSRGRL